MKTMDLTKGKVLNGILLFALPIFLSNILQQLYNLTDVSIIGHSMGDDALSAIGSVSIIYGMFLALLFGMGAGISIVTARFFGAKDEKNLKRSVANTIVLALVWIVIITLAANLALKPLMRYINIPEAVFEEAYSYISVLVRLMVFSFAYNVMSGMLRAIGNSKAPLCFLAISVTTNILLDILFVAILHKGLAGAAYATVAAQALSAFVCFIYIIKKVPLLHITKKDFVISGRMLADLFSSGLSFGLMFSVINIGSFILQGAINSMGKTIIAAHTSARKISELCMMMLNTLANSMSTFSGQNHGAKNYDRIMEGWKKTILMACGISAFLIILIYTAGDPMVRLVSGSSTEKLISTALFYLRLDLPFYFILSVLFVSRNTLQGMGAKITPIIASIMELVLKYFTAKYLAVRLGYLGIALCEPIIWIICAIYLGIAFGVLYRKRTREVLIKTEA